jgi:beta-lactamase regulating signal transducer with metallopeptidase domain/ankyrin repeat protein
MNNPIAEFLVRQFPAWVLQASWQGAALALVVLIVQRSLGSRLPGRWRNALWLLVVARLLLPALPHARFSVYNFVPEDAIVSPPAQAHWSPSMEDESRAVEVSSYVETDHATAAHPVIEASASPFRLPDLPYLWITGALISGGWSVAGHLRMRKRVARLRTDIPERLCSQFASAKRELRVRRAELIVSEGVGAPCVTGFWKANVILPAGLEKKLQPDDVHMVLLHELAHVKRGDLWLAWLGWLATTLHWFNPSVWFALAFARKDREMACDEWVLRLIPDSKSYGMALVRFLELNPLPTATPGTIGIVEGRSALLQRVARIAAWHRPTVIGSIAGFTLLGVIGVLTLTGATTKITSPATVPLPPQEALIHAIFQDDPAAAERALKDGAKPDLDTEFANREILDTNTPVCLAAEQGRLDLIRLFVAHGASLKPGSNSWSTPIDVALRNNYPAIAVYLHDHGSTTDPLIYAAGSGDLDQVKKLTATGKPKTLNDAAGLAAVSGQTATLGLLLAKGANAGSAFHRAAYGGSVDSMRFLLAHGVDIKKAGYDALGIAAYRDHPEAVAFLLQQHVNPNRQKQPTDTRFTNIRPALNMAASGGSLACAKLLLDAGADPNSVIVGDPHMGDTGTTPIDAACGTDNADIVRALLDHGARIDFVDSGGFTPILYAAYSHAAKCLALLIDRGADIKAYNPKWKCGVIDFAAIFDGEDDDRPDMHDTVAMVNRDMATLQVLLDRGIINVNTTTPGISSLLGEAIGNGQTAWSEKLLQMGAKVNAVDKIGSTPLSSAIFSTAKEPRYSALIDELLAKGADPNAGLDNPPVKGDSVPCALKAAIIAPASDEVRHRTIGILIAHGARFPVPRGSDAEKILLAATTGDADTVSKLLAKGVSPNVADSQGWTPLLSAAALTYDAVLKALVDAGADVNAHDSNGDTAIGYAIDRYPDLATFHLLLNKGADVRSLDILESAITNHDSALLRELLKHGASPNVQPGDPPNRFEPLELAVELLMQDFADQKRRDVVTTLIAAGANRNPKQEGYRISLLYFPVENNMIDMVKFLLNAGIDPKKDMDGGKALSETLERHGNKEMKALLAPVLAQNAAPAK